MELIPIAIAAALWGARWEGKVVCFHSDNEAVVAVLNSLSSKAPELMHLLRCMFLFAALRSFWFCARHLPGRENILADAISRDKQTILSSFSLQVENQEHIPQELPQLLYQEAPDWTLRTWIERLSSFLRRH